jgi:hypothetical protein
VEYTDFCTDLQYCTYSTVRYSTLCRKNKHLENPSTQLEVAAPLDRSLHYTLISDAFTVHLGCLRTCADSTDTQYPFTLACIPSLDPRSPTSAVHASSPHAHADRERGSEIRISPLIHLCPSVCARRVQGPAIPVSIPSVIQPKCP